MIRNLLASKMIGGEPDFENLVSDAKNFLLSSPASSFTSFFTTMLTLGIKGNEEAMEEKKMELRVQYAVLFPFFTLQVETKNPTSGSHDGDTESYTRAATFIDFDFVRKKAN